jgi:hypothetical protein
MGCVVLGVEPMVTRARPAAPRAAAQPDRDFGFLWWAHGFRGRSPDGRRLLCVRTGRYGLALDVERLDLRHFGPIGGRASYDACATEPNEVVLRLPPAALTCEAVVGGTAYRCVAAARDTRDYLAYPVRIVEQGRVCQRFDVQQLEFADGAGNRLDADGRLEVVAWPDRVAFLLEVTARKDLADGRVKVGLPGSSGPRPEEHGAWRSGTTRRSVVVHRFGSETDDAPIARVTAAAMDTGRALPVAYDADRGWARVELPAGSWSEADDQNHLDRYRLTLRNPLSEARVARLLFARDAPSPGITGMVAMLRDDRGRPTGIPVQVSKNWHRQADRRFLYEGPWFHGFATVSVPPGSERRIELTIAYCRWGGVPSASHAQLCLIGYGMNQLWDQAAIGSWGESICYDPDINLNRSIVDDIRPLMVTAMGTQDGKWTWTNNVGGGDFLTVFGRDGKRLPLTRMRTAYLSHGPCLTRVVYAGVTEGGEVEARIEVSTPRTDDINRAYHRIRYRVRKPLDFSRLALYQLGADNYNDHVYRSMAFGDAAGLREEWAVAVGGRKYHKRDIVLSGSAPWVSLHGAVHGLPAGGAWAARGLVVRRWKARLGGRAIATPILASYGTENGPPSANAELVPPTDVTRLVPGDHVEADLELVTLPIAADDYYGPDLALRQALRDGANTWRPVHREASDNDLKVQGAGASVARRTPVVVVSKDGRSAGVVIRGGVGYVPVTFRGLRSATGYALMATVGGKASRVDQSVHGEDWYQCDREDDGTHSLTYTLPLAAMRGPHESVSLTLSCP